LTSKNVVTLKFGSKVTQDTIRQIGFPITVLQ